MRLRINKNENTERFFRFSPHICEAYGIDFYTTEDYYDTRDVEANARNALALLSLDEIISRYVYADYGEHNMDVSQIEPFTNVIYNEDEDDTVMVKVVSSIQEMDDDIKEE